MHRFDATGPPKPRSASPSPRSYPRGHPTQRRLPDEEILRLYVEEKLDSSTIGIRTECTSRTVLKIVRALGGVVRGPGGRGDRGPLKLTDAEIIQRYKDGASGKALAKQAGCSHSTLYGLLHRHGVRTRPPAENGAATSAANRAHARFDKAKS
jgi:DNA-binding CsgD family transcriptional regulator